jgi:hypothetical protein
VLVLEYFDWLWCNSNIFLRSLFYFCCEFDIFWSLLFGAVQLNLSPITHIQTYLFFPSQEMYYLWMCSWTYFSTGFRMSCQACFCQA